jgi:predicted pyridoxine 5'-phosphate oxidase superfamily flavin-nucleotide-binding protein
MTLRINGQAQLSIDPELLGSFAVEGKAPRSVMVIHVDEVYFQCARAIVRSELWNPQRFVDPDSLPTPGQILAHLTENRIGGEAYDQEWPERACKTLW